LGGQAKKATDKAVKEATRATVQVLREATTTTEKEARKIEKLGKSKALTPPLLLTNASIASPSQHPRKRDASFAQLSVSRLQQITSSALMDSTGGLCMFKSSSSLDPFYPLMHILCSTRPSPRSGWI
jgi:hypothetical protein